MDSTRADHHDAAPGTLADAPHSADERHHHHSHAATSAHPGHHHLLTVEHISVSFRMYDEDEPFFRARQREVTVIDDLSLSVHEGEIVAIVGASGSGKTLLADAVLGLFEPNALVKGNVWFEGEPVDGAGLARLRGHGISLVPQSVAYLDPLMKVGRQVEEGWRNRRASAGEAPAAGAQAPANSVRAKVSRRISLTGLRPRGRGLAREAAQKRAELFERYGLAPEVAGLYPHELSGGMARRVLLCCALMDDPKLIVADEPTPGLDPALAQRALDDLRAFADGGGGVMLITHDIELALSVADRIAVFRDGTVVEETATSGFAAPELLESAFARQLWHALPEHGFQAPGRLGNPDGSDGSKGN